MFGYEHRVSRMDEQIETVPSMAGSLLKAIPANLTE